MKENEITTLVKRIQAVCPSEAKVEIVPTRQRGIDLVIVLFPPTATAPNSWKAAKTDRFAEKLKLIFEQKRDLKTAYLWESKKIHDLHYGKILPALSDSDKFRVVYCSDNKFVLYAHNLGVFDHEDCPLGTDFIGISSDSYYYYVGSCRNTDFLIDFLMMTGTL